MLSNFFLWCLFSFQSGPGLVPDSAPSLTPDTLALSMMDSEALYTIAAGVKPVSEGFWRKSFPDSSPVDAEIGPALKELRKLPLGPDFETGILVFKNPTGGTKHATAFVAHKPRLRDLISKHPKIFQGIGVKPWSSAQFVMERIDQAPSSTRWRGFGLVFGYPEYAVEFFVTAGETQEKTGVFVTRSFVHLPTFRMVKGGFVYAVPKGHEETGEDRILREKVSSLLSNYSAKRREFIGEGKQGPVPLLHVVVQEFSGNQVPTPHPGFQAAVPGKGRPCLPGNVQARDFRRRFLFPLRLCR